MKIEKLTPEQEARIPEYRDEWLRHGLSTEPANWEEAEQAVRDAYVAAGLEPPKIIIRLASPHEGAIGAAILKNTKFDKNVWAQVGAQVRDQVGDQVMDQVWAQVRDQVGARVRDQVWAQVGAQVRDQVWDQVMDQVWAQVRDQVGARVRDQVWAQVGAQVRDQVWDQVMDQVWAQVRDQVGARVRDQVWAQVGAQVRDQVWDQVMDQVWAQVRDQVGARVWAQVWAQVGAQVRAQVSDAFWSQHEAGWLSWLAFFRRVCDLPNTEKIEPLLRIAQSCGWAWFFDGAAIITDRPNAIHRDEENRLHCETGSALEYRDGFSIYAWHGTRIPAEWINNKASITPKVALTWENIEQRRVAIEIVGWSKILRELDAKVIDADGDPLIGTLVEVNLPDLDRPARFCRVQCGTGREFAIGVPPGITTALAAQAWMQGVNPNEFVRPEIRT
ncbi:hypothetical protein D3C87_915670 [compost metagenome]